MAITASSKPSGQLQEPYARAAGIASMAAGAAGALGLVVYLIWHGSTTTATTVIQLAWAIVFAAAAGAGEFLRRGEAWAQQALLVFWLVVAETAAVLILAAVLWGVPGWWGAFLSAPLAAVVVPVLAVACGQVVVLVEASSAVSRLRYATFVIVSIAAATAVVIVVNLIAHKDPIHKDLQLLARYGISERTRKILDTLEDPNKIRLTCVYTVREKKDSEGEQERLARREEEDRRDRVMELLEEMRQYSTKVEVINAVTDSEKEQVLGRLGLQYGGKAAEHQRLLADFKQFCDQFKQTADKEGERWTKLADKRAADTTYLALWTLPQEVLVSLEEAGQALQEARVKLEAQTRRAGVLDYSSLVDSAVEPLKTLQQELQAEANVVSMIRGIPPVVQANRKAALEALGKCEEAVKALVKAAGAPNDPEPSTPADVLKAFAEAAKDTAKRIREAAAKLDELAGKENLAILRRSGGWYLEVAAGGGMVIRTDMGEIFRYQIAESLDGEESRAALAETYVQKATPQAQKELISGLRQFAPKVETQVRQVVEMAKQRVEKFAAAPDPVSQEIFKLSEEGKVFETVLKPANDLVERAGKLPKLETGGLSARMSERNIIIIEAAGKTEVVDFSEVWPVRGEMDISKPGKVERMFKGDSAISSKLLLMTCPRPFATVLLTYFEPQVDPQMAQMMRLPRPPIAEQDLGELERRLKEGNFKVKRWNLTEEMPADDEDADKPADSSASKPASGPTTKKARPLDKVLLVLPPPPRINLPPYAGRSIEGFGEEHLKKIKRAVDSGTPAVVLMKMIQQRRNPLEEGLAERGVGQKTPLDLLLAYLKDEWGIRVLNEYRLVTGVPDKTMAGRFRVSALAFSFLPLNAFEDHVISRPLQGQRMLWLDVCPIRLGSAPLVQSQALLRVPEGQRTVWATKERVEDLVQEVRSQGGGFITPEYGTVEDGKDLEPPMDVAVAAARQKDPARQTESVRLVVLGVGGSMPDWYVGSQVPELDPEGGISFSDPPSADLDLVVNSVHWAVGSERYIPPGPVRVRTVSPMSSGALTTLWVMCVVVLPVLVLGTGGVVLYLRRR